VILAQWQITEGGTLARLLVPPAGVHALRAPANFMKLEATAAHRLTGHARRLYAVLADKKRQRRPNWEFGLDELRALMGVEDRRAYRVWGQFRRSRPSTTTARSRSGCSRRSSADPSPRSASTGTGAIRTRPREPSPRTNATAPPLIPEPVEDERERLHRRAGEWWRSLSEDGRREWREGPGGMTTDIERDERDFALRAFEQTRD